MFIGDKGFQENGKTYIMGILNVTPDSFSDGGRYLDQEGLEERITELKEDSDIIDVGGESTRPGYTEVSTEAEIKRVVPAIKRIRELCDIPVSVDTMKAEVASAAIRAGASFVNDVSGLSFDPEMGRVIAENGVPCCLMHNRNEIIDIEEPEAYLESVCQELAAIITKAVNMGIKQDTIVLDPGIGFSKTYRQNMVILANLGYFHKLGFPMLLGVSRKSVIGNTLGLPVNEREEATLALSVLAQEAGYSFVRVHDVRANKRAVAMAEALKRFRM